MKNIHQSNLEILAKMRPLDDDFMRELFRNNLPLAQFVLRIIIGKNDLVLTAQETQYDMKRLLGARSLCLDVFGTDSTGKRYDLEVQRTDKGAVPQRARYHSSAMDVELLNTNEEFENLPITYVIFITENDYFGENKPIYLIDRMNTTTGKPFDDGEHIIYVNGAYNNTEDNSDIAKLMHDFRCCNANDMHFEIMAKTTRYYKENPKGVSFMCKLMEDIVNETKIENSIEIAKNLLKLGSLPIEDIAKCTGLSIEEIKKLAEQLKT